MVHRLVSRYRDRIRRADRNLVSAFVNNREGLHEEACYECHQAAETAIKVILNYLNKERGRILFRLVVQTYTITADYYTAKDSRTESV